MILPILLIFLNYLVGSISSAVVVTKIVTGKDIRKFGDKKAGGSNVLKNVGFGWGLVVGVFDVFKAVPLIIFAQNIGVEEIYWPYIAIAAFVGHCWPIWFNFSGGRGIATYIGTIFFMTTRISILPLLVLLSASLYSSEKLKENSIFRWISSPTFTLVSVGLYLLLTLGTEQAWDDTLAILYSVLIPLRRVTARIRDYKTTKNPFCMFLSRLIFDNNHSYCN